MNISQLKTAIPYLIQAGLVPNIIGKHGIGKSSVIAQYAKENGYTFHPFFLGQMSDNGDLLGLPEFDRDSSGKALSVSFVHPAKLPKKPKSILFFDELNRASKELLQAIFQLALEGTLHDYTLPKDSAIIMAMNPATDDYSVLDFADKAFADRFVHINLEPTHEEFHQFMTSKYGTSSVSEFLKQQTKLLEEEDLKPVSLEFVKPSRRSWDRLQTLENTKIPENIFREAGMGIVGTAAMISYSSWKQTRVKVLNGEQILNNYEKVKNEFVSYFKDPKTGELLETPRSDLVSTVCSSVTDVLKICLKDDSITKEQVSNLTEFLLDAPVENCYALLLSIKNISGFSTNIHMRENILVNKELIEKVKEARIARDKYEEAVKKQREEEDEIPF